MTWQNIALYLQDLLGVVLIVRLLKMNLSRVYSVFSAFIFMTLLGSSIFLIARHLPQIDYRLIWLAFQIPVSVLTLWMVYALLGAVLATLPGILAFSRKLLNVVFVFTIAVAILSAKPEFLQAAGGSFAEQAVRSGFIIDRIVSTVCLIVLLVILGFVLWFPVQMPRNLAFFSTGFIIYFAVRTILLLARDVVSEDAMEILSLLDTFALGASFIYWILRINEAGEAIPVRMGHAWRPGERRRLISQLETLNQSLLRSARRV